VHRPRHCTFELLFAPLKEPTALHTVIYRRGRQNTLQLTVLRRFPDGWVPFLWSTPELHIIQHIGIVAAVELVLTFRMCHSSACG
jgi:hypothetical protein